jgi:hypothetical protein
MNPFSSRLALSAFFFSALVACGSASTETTDAPVAPAGDDSASADPPPPPPPATPPAHDAGKSDAAPAQDSGGKTPLPDCPIVGTWTATMACSFAPYLQYTFVANADGTASATIDQEGTVHMSYGFSRMDNIDGTLNFTPTDDTRCPQAATYHVHFDQLCGTFNFQMITDPCFERYSCLSGLTVKRQ